MYRFTLVFNLLGDMNRRFGLSGGVARHMNRILRVPNKFLGIEDLAYLKTGIRDFRGKEERDSGF